MDLKKAKYIFKLCKRVLYSYWYLKERRILHPKLEDTLKLGRYSEGCW